MDGGGQSLTPALHELVHANLNNGKEGVSHEEHSYFTCCDEYSFTG